MACFKAFTDSFGEIQLLLYTVFRKIDFYLVLEDQSSPYNIFTIIWNLSPALISKFLERVRLLLLKMFMTSNLTPSVRNCKLDINSTLENMTRWQKPLIWKSHSKGRYRQAKYISLWREKESCIFRRWQLWFNFISYCKRSKDKTRWLSAYS